MLGAEARDHRANLMPSRCAAHRTRCFRSLRAVNESLEWLLMEENTPMGPAKSNAGVAFAALRDLLRVLAEPARS